MFRAPGRGGQVTGDVTAVRGFVLHGLAQSAGMFCLHARLTPVGDIEGHGDSHHSDKSYCMSLTGTEQREEVESPQQRVKG